MRPTRTQLLARLRDLAASPRDQRLLAGIEAELDETSSAAAWAVAAARALLEASERHLALDPADTAAARLAIEVTGTCLEGLGDERAEAPEAETLGYLWINHADALRLAGPEHDEQAEAAYAKALGLDPARGWWWFQWGLLHKARGRFAEALERTQRARALLGDLRPVIWNLAICATALGEGARALEAWRRLGLPAEPNARSGMPEIAGLPPCRVRVPMQARPPEARVAGAPGAAGPLFEVLWAQPLSPCHGVIQSGSWGEGGADWGDLVLWDGAPLPHTDATMAPCFAMLARLR
ncbi:MAG: tetratricopeptide repeat protein, partial [Myxococcales bacterium]|nr:tetratricopeptide repeat protein [Myxococcales bacterium]